MFGGRNKQGRTDNKFSGSVSLLYYLCFTEGMAEEQRSEGMLKIPFSYKMLRGLSICMDTLGQLHPSHNMQKVLPHLGAFPGADLKGLGSNTSFFQISQLIA